MNVVEVELRSRTRMRFEGEAALQAVAQLVARVLLLTRSDRSPPGGFGGE